MGDTVAHEKPKGAWKNVAKTALKIVCAVALIVWMVEQKALNFSAFAKLSSPVVLVFCAVATFVQIFSNNYRWLLLLRGQGFMTTIRRTLSLTFIGMFFNFAMPGGVGGDVVKGYYIVQDHPEKKLVAAMSIFMDRLTGFFVMIAMAFFAVFFNYSKVAHSRELTSIGVGVTLLFLGFVIFYALSLSKLLQASWAQTLFAKVPGGKQIRHVYEALHAYRRAPRELALAMALSFVSQAFVIAFCAVIGDALGERSIPLSVYAFLVPLGLVVQALPISPAGIGVGQAAFYFLFNSYLGRESDLGPTAMTVMQLMNFGMGLIGAVFYLQRSRVRPLAADA